MILLRKQALIWFEYGDMEVKRLILETVGSNLTLADKKLSIKARKPFVREVEKGEILDELGYKDSNLDTQDQNLMSYH